MTIDGGSATALSKDAYVFYDTELLAVVHRAKVKSSRLVTTQVWAWQGRRAQPGERELQKVQELARRYNASPVSGLCAGRRPAQGTERVCAVQVAVEQAREPPELVSVLGGQLVTRQGTRVHWSAENTAMHLVRSVQGLVYIDELDIVRALLLFSPPFSSRLTIICAYRASIISAPATPTVCPF